MKLYIVRHAHAGSRSAWTEPDHLRPLSDQGHQQAGAIATFLRAHLDPVTVTIASSPAVRCMTTVAPTAKAIGTTVVEEPRVAEGSAPLRHDDLLAEFVALGTDLVLCSHGDVIPSLLHTAIDDGLEIDAPFVWHKASIWDLTHDGTNWTDATYHRP